ncbi:MAG: bifunctional riboflavin kinase/FAD synthetase [Acutalibacteraceae bacterium]
MFAFESFNESENTVLALGNFDGLHLGHMKVLEKTLEVSKENGLVPAVMLFDEHPKSVIDSKRPPRILTDEARDEKLRSMSLRIIKVSFEKFRNLSPEEFVLTVYCKMNVRAICCGFNYHYGKNAAGNTETLKKSCDQLGIKLFTLDEVDFEGEAVSSTRIRQAIENGSIRKANQMLGREFSYKFEVVKGDERGRLLGFPTINQFFPDDFVTARHGVYASKVMLGSQWYPAVTNIGIRPTVGTESLRSETFIIGFSGDLYGEEIEVYLLDFIRDEKKFSSFNQLAKAMADDAEKAQEIYNKECNS